MQITSVILGLYGIRQRFFNGNWDRKVNLRSIFYEKSEQKF